MSNDITQGLLEACIRLSADAHDQAQALVRKHYPLAPIARNKRGYTQSDLLRTALRDGFVDRYTGKRLVFPGTLRLLSTLMPAELPYDSNWAYDKCHPIYWELYPTLDHVFPIARGGADVVENWVVTSQQMNSAKAHWTLEELGWKLVQPGALDAWDGLLGWFRDYTAAHPELCAEHKHVRSWRAVAEKASTTA